MAKGAQAKEEVMRKILETFPNAFQYEKELRIPMLENGEEVQIKVALTCAKVNVNAGGDTAMPGDFPAPASAPVTPQPTEPIAPTADEKARVAELFAKLGL